MYFAPSARMSPEDEPFALLMSSSVMDLLIFKPSERCLAPSGPRLLSLSTKRVS